MTDEPKKPARELKLTVFARPMGVDIVYEVDVSSWMFKAGEYAFVEKSDHETRVRELEAELDNLKLILDGMNKSYALRLQELDAVRAERDELKRFNKEIQEAKDMMVDRINELCDVRVINGGEFDVRPKYEKEVKKLESENAELKKKIEFADEFIKHNSGSTLDKWIKNDKESKEVEAFLASLKDAEEDR